MVVNTLNLESHIDGAALVIAAVLHPTIEVLLKIGTIIPLGLRIEAAWPSGKARVCKTLIGRFDSDCGLQKTLYNRESFIMLDGD